MGKIRLNRLHTSVLYKQQQHSCNVSINSSVICIDEKYVLSVQCDVVFCHTFFDGQFVCPGFLKPPDEAWDNPGCLSHIAMVQIPLSSLNPV